MEKPRTMSPQEIAELTARDRHEAAIRLIKLLRPKKVITAKKNGRTEIWVQQ
ncbi:MAG: hypothetical protein HY434_00955 [Candidatus Liptonbacteria bacterium]|nr:hypothetical protein [Candidatus Liptonbacteria bacterium]